MQQLKVEQNQEQERKRECKGRVPAISQKRFPNRKDRLLLLSV